LRPQTSRKGRLILSGILSAYTRGWFLTEIGSPKIEQPGGLIYNMDVPAEIRRRERG